MSWCAHCVKKTKTVVGADGLLCCTTCGRVVDVDNFANDVVFIKGPGGQSQASGRNVRTVESNYSESRERTLRKGRDEISDMVFALSVRGGDSVIDQASAYYKVAVGMGFTRGRRTSHVAAACLYVTCRENKKPYLLIDFSEYLQVNVYVLGAVFLQLCQILSLQEHPVIQKPVDPSLFMHRFTERLLGGKKKPEVCKTALRILSNMKRDWMNTGRKPSSLCGAALYISSLAYGLKVTQADIIRVVHICEATLTKRLIEFENTDSGSLTIEEFNLRAEELEREAYSNPKPIPAAKSSDTVELLCEHKSTSKHFAHGLCRACYDDFIELSGGLDGGSEPPAFQRAEQERMAIAASKEAEESSLLEKGSVRASKDDQHRIENKKAACQSQDKSDKIGHQTVDETACVQPKCNEDIDTEAGDESDTFDDIDDAEVNGYLHDEKEKVIKKMIWEEMNKEYLQEQAAKEAAAAAARKAYAAKFQNCSEEALELAAAAAAGVAKSRKEKQQKRAQDAKNAPPPQTAAEAARQMLAKKRLSSKINYDVLDKLFEEPTTKKKRDDSDNTSKDINGNEEEPTSDILDNEDNIYDDDGDDGGDPLYAEEEVYEDYGFEF